MNNHIAEELTKQAREFFGSGYEPLPFFKACNDAIRHLEELSQDRASSVNRRKMENQRSLVEFNQLNETITKLESKLNSKKRVISILKSKLTVANHKCSAYKSILKEQVK